MSLKKINSSSRRSCGQWCQDFWLNLNRSAHSLRRFLYNRERHEILGRNGKRWSKLAAFYFFFFAALGGFFCFYLSIFMSLVPLDQPRYILKDSRLTSRANPLSPGLSFRPQLPSDRNAMLTLISLSSSVRRRRKKSIDPGIDVYTKSIDEFLKDYYRRSNSKNFTINNVGECNSDDKYGYKTGKPCILIKINKLVGFTPQTDTNSPCPSTSDIPVRCTGENPADQNKLGDTIYYSESGSSDACGSIGIQHFPYNGKEDQKDVYQAPYVWVQFTNLTANTLISVECRVFGSNLFYDKMAQRASIRFQFHLKSNT